MVGFAANANADPPILIFSRKIYVLHAPKGVGCRINGMTVLHFLFYSEKNILSNIRNDNETSSVGGGFIQIPAISNNIFAE